MVLSEIPREDPSRQCEGTEADAQPNLHGVFAMKTALAILPLVVILACGGDHQPPETDWNPPPSSTAKQEPATVTYPADQSRALPEWVESIPPGTDDVSYFVGVSSWGTDKQEGRNEAERACRAQAARRFGTRFTSALDTALSKTMVEGRDRFHQKVTSEWTNELVRESIAGLTVLKWFEERDGADRYGREHALCELRSEGVRNSLRAKVDNLEKDLGASAAQHQKMVEANTAFVKEVKRSLMDAVGPEREEKAQ